MTRANPSHPGASVRENCIDAFGLTIADAAKHLRVAEETLTAICEERAPITPDMAVRFEQAFGSTAEFWLRAQAHHDLAQVRRSCEKIERIEVAA
jgi:addiction module HigA family antidote